MTRILTLALLMTLPGLVSAQSSCAEKYQAQSCASGTTWNSDTKTCEEAVSS